MNGTDPERVEGVPGGSSEERPVLSPEEWQRKEVRRADECVHFKIGLYGALDLTDDVAGESVAVPLSLLGPLAALTLYADCQRLTWDDVDLVLDQAEATLWNAREVVNPGASETDRALIRSRAASLRTTAARMAALLPPRPKLVEFEPIPVYDRDGDAERARRRILGSIQ